MHTPGFWHCIPFQLVKHLLNNFVLIILSSLRVSFEPNISHMTKDSVAKNSSVFMLAADYFQLKYKKTKQKKSSKQTIN